jgi:hypothetical protein
MLRPHHVALLVVASCAAPPPDVYPTHPAPRAAAPIPRATMPADFPSLPPGLPSITELADLIATTFPPAARGAAAATLRTEVLPWDLRNLAGHPYRRRLVELVYEHIAIELGPDVEGRPARLGDVVCDRRGGKLTQRIHGLAVARYLRDRGGDIPATASAGYIDPARPYLRLGEDAFAAEAGRAAADMDAWEADARAAHPGCMKAQRLTRIHDRFALRSTHHGNFDVASGPLYVFLREVGERPRLVDVH